MQTQITRRCVIEEETEEYLQKRLLFAMKLFRRQVSFVDNYLTNIKIFVTAK